MTRYWRITEGTSRARVAAEDYAGALERAKQIGFPKPESVAVMERFRTDDGYMLYLHGGEWLDTLIAADRDLAFDADGYSWPIDAAGERLDGEFLV